MECKCISQENDEPSGVLELIDTLWNVNYTARKEFLAQMRELIDTLWNVNEF